MSGYSIRFIELGDLPKVGHLHCEVFPNDLRSQLGAKVVARSFARKLSRQTEVRGLGAFKDQSGDLLGFCFGGTNGELARGLDMYDSPLIAFHLLLRPQLLSRLELRKRLKERWPTHMQKDRGASSVPAVTEVVRYYDILSLAVSSHARKLGIGKALMALHEAYALQEMCMAMSLTSPMDDQNTIDFYEHIGFHKKLDGRGIWNGQMVKVLKKITT